MDIQLHQVPHNPWLESNMLAHAGNVDKENRLQAIDPLCNVVADRLKDALQYYALPSTPRDGSREGSQE